MKLFKYYLEAIVDFSEWEEVDRTIEELGLAQTAQEIIAAFKRAKTQELSTDVWRELNNTDYNVATEEDVKKRLKVYQRDPKNYNAILKKLQNNNIEPALILYTPKHGYQLVAGNTRLMVSKVNDIIPQVKIIKLKD